MPFLEATPEVYQPWGYGDLTKTERYGEVASALTFCILWLHLRYGLIVE